MPALIVLFAFLVEGSMDTWSGLYLRQELEATAGIAAGVFMAFSSAVTFGRLFAGRVLFGLGRRTVLVSGIGSAVGGIIAALTHSSLVVGVAFLLLGFCSRPRRPQRSDWSRTSTRIRRTRSRP